MADVKPPERNKKLESFGLTMDLNGGFEKWHECFYGGKVLLWKFGEPRSNHVSKA
ncbi:hypothetical protein YC2023_068492 [Brassica napus]